MSIHQVYARYGGTYEHEEESLREAIAMLRAWNEMGECYPIGVYDREANVVHVPDSLPIGVSDNGHRLRSIRRAMGLPQDHAFASVEEFELH